MNRRGLIACAALALGLPCGAALAGAPIEERTLPNGAALENDRLVVTATAGATGVLVTCKAGDARTQIELALVADDGVRAAITRAGVAGSAAGEPLLRVVAGAAEADVKLSAGNPVIEVKPGKGAACLEARVAARYVVLPDFFADDILYDPLKYNSSPMVVPAENFLLHLLEGGRAALLLVWAAGLEPKTAGKEPTVREGDEKEPRVELLAAGDGEARRYTASRVEFLGKPVYAAVMAGEGVWHEEGLRSLPGAQTSPIAWRRPFEAKWRADFVAEGFDKAQMAEFLKQAEENGLMQKGNWTGYTEKELTRSGFWGVGIESRDFKAPDKTGKLPAYGTQHGWSDTWAGWTSNPVWPAVFRGNETLITPMARWPMKSLKPLEAAQEQRRAMGKEPLRLIHVYRRVVIYPIDRVQATPLDRQTVVDLMRETLGIGPCEYVLDLDGLKTRPFFMDGREKIMYSGWMSAVGICPLYDQAKGLIGRALKEKRKLDEKEMKLAVGSVEGIRVFMNTIWNRNMEYRQWGRDLIRFCEEQAKRTEKVKPVADDLAGIARRIEAEMELKKMRFVVPSAARPGKGERATGDQALAYWNDRLPAVVKMIESGDLAEYRKAGNTLAGSPPDGVAGAHTNLCGDEIDWMVVRLRRMVREIRHKAGTTDTNDAEVARFCAKVREQCHAILRNQHKREGWDFY